MSAVKSLKPWLLCSVLLNVFLVGGIGGGLYHWLAVPKPAEIAINQHGLRQAMFKLPLDRRKELRHLLLQNRADSQPLLLAGREARMGVIKQLEAPTLDREILATELARAREADMSLRALVDTSVAQFASTLPRDERMKLVEALYLRGQAKEKVKTAALSANKPRS